jgi:hypothetical protein
MRLVNDYLPRFPRRREPGRDIYIGNTVCGLLMKRRSNFELALSQRFSFSKLPTPQEEYIFCPGRKWRFDFAYPDKKVAIECEGGSWIQGRHNRGTGFANDCEKYNAAALLGWRVLRYTPQMIDRIIPDVEKLF